MSSVETVNTANPIQFRPTFQSGEQRRRERVRVIFFISMAAHLLLFSGLLIQGCRSKAPAPNAASDGYPSALVMKQSGNIE